MRPARPFIEALVLAVTAFVAVSCGGMNSGESTVSGLVSSTSSTNVATSTTPTLPTTTTLPPPPPLPQVNLEDPLVWYGPNFGSVDFLELFSQPELWETTRQQVDVFKFYSQSVSGFPHDISGDKVLPAFIDVGAFEKLVDWGIAISIETGAVKFFECEGVELAAYANLGIDNIEANGGRVSFLSMDEPLIGGQVTENGQTCGHTMEETAAAVATFIDLVHQAHPDVIIGDIEAYPHYPVADIEQWVLVLEEAGAKPAFLHLDVDIERVEVEGQDVTTDLHRLRDFAESRAIPFGVILTANWTFTDTDERYYQSTMRWTETVKAALGRPTHVILQSWWGPAASGLHDVPSNLPDDDPDVHSHTRLILDALALFD